MALMTWTEVQDDIKAGIADDKQKEIVSMLNKLYDHVADGAERSQIGASLDALISCVVDYFAHQEKELMAKGCSDYDCYKEEHDKLVGICTDLQIQFHASEADVTEKVGQVVEDWLDSCIPAFDFDCSETLNS